MFQIIYVTGGEELTIISTAASATMENVRIEVLAYTKLVLEVPDFTVSGIYQSVRVCPSRYLIIIKQSISCCTHVRDIKYLNIEYSCTHFYIQ